MALKTYILCPGQGAQVVGMGKDFLAGSAVARETFEQANRVVGFDLAKICFEGPEERLNQTDISQPAIFVTGVACYRAAVEAGAIAPDAVVGYAGLSLGEYTALHLAGAFGFEDGLRLVSARGRYMQEAAVAVPSGMVALVGADEATAGELCRENAGGQVLVCANFNAPGQIVVSGAAEACERLTAAASTRGLRAVPLKVAGAFHSPLMQPAADRMRRELDQVAIEAPRVSAYANVTAQLHTTPAAIKDLLVRQIVSPVRWQQTMEAILAGGESRLVELAPGRTLTGLVRKIDRKRVVDNLASFDTLAAHKV